MGLAFNEEKLAAEVAKQVKPLLAEAVADLEARSRAIIAELLANYTVVNQTTFEKRGATE